MSCNMKLDICQNQLQLENSQAEENHENEAKVEEVFKSVTHLHDVNEDSSDDSSSGNDLPLREMSVLHDLSVKSKIKSYPAFKEPDICTIPVTAKKNCKNEANPEVVEEKLPPSALPTKVKDEPKQCTKNDNVIRKSSNAGECKTSKENKDAVQSSVKVEDTLSNGPTLVKEQLQPEETSNRPKLDEIFPNSVEESKMNLISEPPCARVATEQRVVAEEKINPVSPVPAKKAKVEILGPSKELPVPKIETTSPPVTEPEVKKSISVPPPPPTSTKDLGDKPHAKKPLPPATETKQAKTENNANNAPTPVAVKKEEKEAAADGKAKATATPSTSRNQDDASAQEKKVNKQRPTTKPTTPPVVHQRVPPKESIMAGGECFASVDGIGQETRSSVAATTSRRTSNIIQRNKESCITRTTVSKHFNKLRKDKNWKKKHLVIAGGIGIAMVCFYAYYKNKT